MNTQDPKTITIRRGRALALAILSSLMIVGPAPAADRAGTENPETAPVSVGSVEGVATSERAAPSSAPEFESARPGFAWPADSSDYDMEIPVIEGEASGAGEDECEPCKRELLTIDLKTREIITRESLDDPNAEEFLLTRAGEGDAFAYEALAETPRIQVNDFSDLWYVPYPAGGEFPKQVKIRTRYVDTNGIDRFSSCSGTLIDPKHVITAGHCVYKHDGEDNNGNDYTVNNWAVDVTVIPGYSDGNEPFGNATGVSLHSWNGWTVNEDHDYDVAIIDLDRPIGALTGWRGYGSSGDCDWYTTGIWKHIGYPGEVFDGEKLYQQFGSFDGCGGEILSYDKPTYKGQSGSGGIRDNAVWSVISHRTCFIECGGRDTRLRSNMVNSITGWISADKPSSLDLVAMDVEVTVGTAFAGSQMYDFDFLIHNYSSASYNGSVSYEIYLSSNSTISQNDIYVASGSFSYNFGPLSSARVIAVPPVIPANVPTGDYKIGVYLTTTDVNMGNNGSHGVESEDFTVLCPSGPPPAHNNPGNGWECMPLNLTLDWTDVGVGADYQLRVGTWCGTGSLYDTSLSQHTVYGLEPGKTYYWQTRAKTACGSWGNWSNCFSFKTVGPPNPVSTFTAPAEGATCQPTTLNLDWEPVPGADRYQITLGTACGSGPTYTITNGTEQTVSGLLDGTEYHWRARARSSCGDYSAWSECRHFTTQHLSVPAPVLAYPSQGQACLSGDQTVGWQLVPNADAYDVQLGTACQQGSIVNSTGWNVTFNGLATGTYHWRVRAYACGEVGAWSACQEFDADADAPQLTGTPYSTAHSVGQWASDPMINMNWDAASDACGVDSYVFAFDTSPNTIPDGINGDETGELFGESPLMADGQDIWFHLLARDIPSNETTPTHVGPFWIDTTGPNAVNLHSDTPVGQWTNASSIQVDWETAIDAGSGTAGYSFEWNPDPNHSPDQIVDGIGLSITLDEPNESTRWFHIKAVDHLGNWGSVAHLGPFQIDSEIPKPEFSSPGPGEEYAHLEDMNISWSANEGGSPFAKVVLSYSVDEGPFHEIATLLPGEDVFEAMQYGWTVPFHVTSSAMLKLELHDEAMNVGTVLSDVFAISANAVDAPATQRVDAFSLAPNSPNPFNPITSIRYSLPRASRVRLDIFDIQGRRVRTLVDENQDGPAEYSLRWNGTNQRGQTVASGIYYYRLQAEGFEQTRRMTLLK